MKRTSPWIEHVKSFALSKGIKYFDALKDPECKASYKKASPSIKPNADNKKTSPWIEHVKAFALSKGIKYFDALKDPECKATYKTGGGPFHATRFQAVAPLANTAEVRTPVRHPLTNAWVDPATGRRLNQVVPAEAIPVETRGATRVRRNGRGVTTVNMTRHGKPKPTQTMIRHRITQDGMSKPETRERLMRTETISKDIPTYILKDQKLGMDRVVHSVTY
jgi:hypothetical protein